MRLLFINRFGVRQWNCETANELIFLSFEECLSKQLRRMNRKESLSLTLQAMGESV